MDSDDLPNARDLEELVQRHTRASSRRVPGHLTFQMPGSANFALAGTSLCSALLRPSVAALSEST